MSARQQPRLYLRMDPNLDQHPDPQGMVLLLCAAARQSPRGRFESLSVLERTLGRARARHFLEPRREGKTPDVIRLPDGRYYVDGWDEWQEGDWTVHERVRRLRNRKTVAEPLHEALQGPLPDSDAPSRSVKRLAVSPTPNPSRQHRRSRKRSEPAIPELPEPSGETAPGGNGNGCRAVVDELRERGKPPSGAWEQILGHVAKAVNEHSFATWFRPTEELGVITDGEGERLVIETPNDQFRSWITRNYRTAMDAACQAAGVTAGLTFVTRAEAGH